MEIKKSEWLALFMFLFATLSVGIFIGSLGDGWNLYQAIGGALITMSSFTALTFALYLMTRNSPNS